MSPLRHLLVTQDYPPLGGGMARRHVELCRRLAPDPVVVSTVAADRDQSAAVAEFDAGEPYRIIRQPFPFRGAKTVINQARWARALVAMLRASATGAPWVVHCGNIRPAGYAVWWAHRVTGVPYLVFVYGGDLLRERRKMARSPLKRWTARRIFENSAGVVAISAWSATLAATVMQEAGVHRAPPVLINELGTDPGFFRPARSSGTLRARLRVGAAPLLLTVARLVPHKGIDMAIRALATLSGEFPRLHYLIVGRGDDGPRLTALAAALGVGSRLTFAGNLTDAEVAEAYATADVYVGLSRVDAEINAEGFGISFVEAAASGTPSVAGDSGGVRSAVRDGETGILVPPTGVEAAANAIRLLLTDDARRQAMGRAARAAVESHYNWDRVAGEVRAFAERVAASPLTPPETPTAAPTGAPASA